MISQTLSQLDLTIYARISLVIFMCVYLGTLFWILHPRQKPVTDMIAKSILEDDKTTELMR